MTTQKELHIVCTQAIQGQIQSFSATGDRGRFVTGTATFSLDQCTTKLGRWLGETVGSLVSEDSASACLIAMPTSVEREKLATWTRTVLGPNSIHPLPRDMRAVYTQMARFAVDRLSDSTGDATSSPILVRPFRWPALGSDVVSEAGPSVAQYLDVCGRLIRKTDGVVLHAGASQQRLPESIAATMSSNRGMLILSEVDRCGVAHGPEISFGYGSHDREFDSLYTMNLA